mmetsp:Transcript_17519/g.44120  ORF Transcript_17519/g.44120 Transcript_17519/m.44120 type:complete len:1028 (-) Transcript_17519:21-3104(-)
MSLFLRGLLVLVFTNWALPEALAEATVPVASGQAFIDAVYGLYLNLNTSQSLTVTFLNAVNVTDIALPVQGAVPPRGAQLTLQGVNDSIVLSLGMRSNFTGVFGSNGASSMAWRNLVLVDMCSELIIWNPRKALWVLTSSNTWLFPRSRVLPSQTRTNVTVYVPYSELISFIYWQLIYHAPFPSIQNNWAKVLLEYAPPAHSRVTYVDPFAIRFEYFELAGGYEYNVTMRATNNHTDPLRLVSMGGTLMEHRLCNETTGGYDGAMGTPEQWRTANLSVTPLWLAHNRTTLEDSLVGVAGYTLSRSQEDPVAALMILTSMSLADLQARPNIRYDTVMMGPFNHVASDARRVVLDLAGKEQLLQLATGATLMVDKLWLTGLAPSPLPGGAGNTTLTLSAINRGLNVQIQMSNCTLVVAPWDFAALLSAAKRKGRWQAGAVATRALMSGITAFDVHPSEVPSGESLLLSAYTGYGVNATRLRLVPTVALAVDAVLPDWPDTGAESEDTNTAVQVGVGVGVGVGVPILIAAIAGAVMWSRRSGRGAAYGAGKGSPGSDAAVLTVKEPGMSSMDSAGKATLAHSKSNGLARVLDAPSHASRDVIAKAVTQAQEAMVAAVSSSLQAAGGSDAAAKSLGSDPMVTAPMAGSGDAGKASGAAGSAGAGSAGLGAQLQAANGSSAAQLAAGVQGSSSHSPSTSSATNAKDTPGLDPLKQVAQRANQIKADADKLTLISVLGRGAWGTVYKGTWRGLTVAVKTVLFSEREDGDTKLPHERAIMEAAVCTSVQHRNVVSTYHYDIKPVRAVVDDDSGEGLRVHVADESQPLGTTDWKLFLVQEWCNSTLGQALRSWLLHKRESREPLIDLLLGLLIDVAQGVGYLHDKNIIHGDLKPENVLLRGEPTCACGITAKLTDFGLSTALDPTATHVSNFKSGTPFFIAPELLTQGKLTPAADIYSLGVVLWQVYTSDTPWRYHKTTQTFSHNPAFPCLPHSAPPAFVDLVLRCTQARPEARPSIQEVVAVMAALHDDWVLHG